MLEPQTSFMRQPYHLFWDAFARGPMFFACSLSIYLTLNLDLLFPGLQLFWKQCALDLTTDGSPSLPLVLGFFTVMDVPRWRAYVSGPRLGLLHSGHASLPSLGLPHEHQSHCLNKALTRTESFSNSLHCKSGLGAKAESITPMHQHIKQNYDLQVIHVSINCLFFPVPSEILATIESLGIINSWTRRR